MDSIKKRFDTFKRIIPDNGDVILLWYTVKGMGYKDKDIIRAFKKLVSKESYDKKDTDKLLTYLKTANSIQNKPYIIRN